MLSSVAFSTLLVLAAAADPGQQPVWSIRLSFAGAAMAELDSRTALVAASDTASEVLLRAAQHGYLIVEPDLVRVFLGASLVDGRYHLTATVLLDGPVGEQRAGQVAGMLELEPIAIRIGGRRVVCTAVSGPVSALGPARETAPVASDQVDASPGPTVALLFYNLQPDAVTTAAVEVGLAALVAAQFSTPLPLPTVTAGPAALGQAGSTVMASVTFGPAAGTAAAALQSQVSAGNAAIQISTAQTGTGMAWRGVRVADTADLQDEYVLVTGTRGCCRIDGEQGSPPTMEYHYGVTEVECAGVCTAHPECLSFEYNHNPATQLKCELKSYRANSVNADLACTCRSTTAAPSSSPTPGPTLLPTLFPTTSVPMAPPTRAPSTSEPTGNPTGDPTASPTPAPTANPAATPTRNPTANPTQNPTENPTANPTANPTPTPTRNPTANPTQNPTENPTANPTANPTTTPTRNPTANPTANPGTSNPTANPTTNPTKSPTATPTKLPTWPSPTVAPTGSPTTDPCRLYHCSTDCHPIMVRLLDPAPPGHFSIWRQCGWSSDQMLCITGGNTSQREVDALYESRAGACSQHSRSPTPAPSPGPTVSPTPNPTTSPSLRPTPSPTPSPTAPPTTHPTPGPTPSPSGSPTSSHPTTAPTPRATSQTTTLTTTQTTTLATTPPVPTSSPTVDISMGGEFGSPSSSSVESDHTLTYIILGVVLAILVCLICVVLCTKRKPMYYLEQPTDKDVVAVPAVVSASRVLDVDTEDPDPAPEAVTGIVLDNPFYGAQALDNPFYGAQTRGSHTRTGFGVVRPHDIEVFDEVHEYGDDRFEIGTHC